MQQRLIVVTGAARGIGQAISQRLAEEGADLVLIDLADLAETVKLVNHARGATSRPPLAYQADVTDERQLARLVQQVGSERGPVVHGLVASHAAFIFHSVATATTTDWLRSFHVNVVGSALVIRAFLPLLSAAGDASIVLLGSISSFLAQPNCATYSVTKAAIVQLARACAYDLAHLGIRCNALCPGTIETPISVTERAEHQLSMAEWQRMKTADVMLDRVGTPREVANAAVFLLSSESSYTTGSSLMVDGGQTACTVKARTKAAL
jgi:NAD(P)-dependent dehydrogenase (short-subunit alcohol dehydrogenase family)